MKTIKHYTAGIDLLLLLHDDDGELGNALEADLKQSSLSSCTLQEFPFDLRCAQRGVPYKGRDSWPQPVFKTPDKYGFFLNEEMPKQVAKKCVIL